jgi:hypothetical protein
MADNPKPAPEAEPEGDEGAEDQAFEGYAYKPSILGSPWVFALRDDGLVWGTGAHGGVVPYRAIRRVRMSFRPATLQSNRYLTEVWAEKAPKLSINSTSWKSLVEQGRQDAPYSRFVKELHRRAAEAGSRANFVAGSPAVLYWPGLAVFSAAAVAIVVLVGRSLYEGSWQTALILLGFLAFFIWQAGNFFYKNRPRRYSPDAPPADLMPGA